MSVITKLDEAVRLFENNDLEQAEGRLQVIIAQDPKNVKAHFLLGVCRFRTKNYKSAEGQFRTVIALAPNHYKALYYLGLACERQGRQEEARKYYREALRIQPNFAKAREKLGDQPGNVMSVGKPGIARPYSSPDAPFTDRIEKKPANRLKQQEKKKGCLFYIFAAIRGLSILALGATLGFFFGSQLAGEGGAIIGAIAGLLIFQIINVRLFGKKRKL